MRLDGLSQCSVISHQMFARRGDQRRHSSDKFGAAERTDRGRIRLALAGAITDEILLGLIRQLVERQRGAKAMALDARYAWLHGRPGEALILPTISWKALRTPKA